MKPLAIDLFLMFAEPLPKSMALRRMIVDAFSAGGAMTNRELGARLNHDLTSINTVSGSRARWRTRPHDLPPP